MLGGGGVPFKLYRAAKRGVGFLGRNYGVAGRQRRAVCNKPQKRNLCFHSSARLITGLHAKPGALNISRLQLAISGKEEWERERERESVDTKRLSDCQSECVGGRAKVWRICTVRDAAARRD